MSKLEMEGIKVSSMNCKGPGEFHSVSELSLVELPKEKAKFLLFLFQGQLEFQFIKGNTAGFPCLCC